VPITDPRNYAFAGLRAASATHHPHTRHHGPVLRSLAPARRGLVLALVALVVLGVVAATAFVAVRQVRGEAVADQARPGPVVLVPGYGGTVSDLDPLVAEVRREGRTAVVFRPSGDGTGDLRTQAKRLAVLVERTLREQHGPSVDLVGYSAGGVIARLYVRDEGGAAVVRRVLTIGSPQHGTDVAQLAQDAVGSCPTACEQLATDSELVRQLNAGDETPDGPRWMTVRSTSDRIVVPTDTAELDGAVNLTVQALCPGARTSHGDLPGDPVTLRALTATLGTDRPTAPTGVSC